MDTLLLVLVPIGLFAIGGYVYLWRKVLRRDAEFRKARPAFEKMLIEAGWKQMRYQKISVIEQEEIGTTRMWFLSKPTIYRSENNFVFLNPDGIDVYFEKDNPFKSLVCENQRKINAIKEDEEEIELHYSQTFARIERVIIEKEILPRNGE